MADYSKWEVNKPVFHHFYKDYHQYGCGASALSFLTGESSYKIYESHGFKNHYSDSFMVRFLRKRGFKIVQIRDKVLLDRQKQFAFEDKITEKHVLLYCLKLGGSKTRQEFGSWVVIFGYPSIFVHNFEITKMKCLDLANFPVYPESRYIVWRKDWNI